MKKILLALSLLLAAFSTVSAQRIAVNTDLVMDGLMTPNIGFEMVTGNKSSLSVNALMASKPWGKDVKGWAIQPEYRYYFSGRPMYGWFVGAGAIGTVYDVTWGGKVYDGHAIGGGITYGYVLNFKDKRRHGGLWDHITIDFHCGFGGIFYSRKEYFVNDNFESDYTINGTQRANAHGYYLLPTRFGISVCYIIY